MQGVEQFSLAGRVAIVTGAGRGLGESIAANLAGAGATVTVADIDGASAESVARALRTGGHRALPLTMDVAQEADADRVVSETVREFGRLDIMVNNAGINRGGEYPAQDLSVEIWDSVMAVNLRGVFLSARAAGRQMIAQGQGGKIINMASVLGFVVSRLTSRHPLAYCTSKAGVIMMTKVLAMEWAQYRINVNSIAPAYIRTAILNPDPRIQQEMVRDTPLGHLGEPQDVAGVALFLASPASDYMTGQTILLDGGYTCW